MQSVERRSRIMWWAAVAAIALAGLALRVAAARGGLWSDEAWSVIYAVQARDPLGVFLRINHDNNHHLYSLWLQAIGPAASPLLARAPAILSGTLCIVAAALLVGRRSPTGGLVAALFFAVSPALVIFGSEARGYSLMLLAALLMLLSVTDALDGRPTRGQKWWLAALALFGMFSHMTMAAPIAIVTLWVYFERRREADPISAFLATLSLMGPAIAASAGVVLFVFTVAALSPTGMRLGGYLPFSLRGYVAALNDLDLWSAGVSAPAPWLGPLGLGVVALLIGLAEPRWLGSRARLYALLILFVPVAAATLRPGNTAFARYYLTSTVGLLLLLSHWIARGLAGRPAVRATAALLLATVVGVSLYRDSLLVAVDRGRPAASVRDMAELSPAGARLAVGQPRLEAVVAVAALRSGYRVQIADKCAPADFLLDAQLRGTETPAHLERCGVPMEAIDSSVTVPLTGDSWILYRARSLQSPGAADSGPPPGVRNRRLTDRAGVAQG
jgi:hypothetical protein